MSDDLHVTFATFGHRYTFNIVLNLFYLFNKSTIVLFPTSWFIFTYIQLAIAPGILFVFEEFVQWDSKVRMLQNESTIS